MKLSEELNKVIDEALGWDKYSQEYKDMLSENEKLVNSMKENCKKLRFELTDQGKLKDGTNRTTFMEFKTSGNYEHEISLRFQSGELRYIVNQQGKQDTLTWQNVRTPEDIDNAFKEIVPKFEGLE